MTDKSKGVTIFAGRHVHVVLETKGDDATVHGVFSKREYADNKAIKLRSRKDSGYIAVLKQTLLGGRILL